MIRNVFCLLFSFLFAVYAADCNYVDDLGRSSAKDAFIFISWNACNFGCSKSDKEIGFMANVLRFADIVAIQEVSTSDCGAQTTAKLADELNRKGAKWDYIVTESTHDSPSKERYSFLWKTKRISLMSRSCLVVFELSPGMEREPALVRFKIDGKELYIASFHLAPTKKNPRAEIEFIGVNKKLFDKPNIVMAGDFNLSHLEMNDIVEMAMGFKSNISGETSLKSKLTKKGKYLNKEYDNVFSKGVVVRRAGIIDFVSKMAATGTIDLSSEENGLKKAKQISDHLPVFVELSF